MGVGARYGLIDRVASAAASPEALQYLSVPQYGDYQGRVEYRPTEYSRLTAFAFLFGGAAVSRLVAAAFICGQRERALPERGLRLPTVGQPAA